MKKIVGEMKKSGRKAFSPLLNLLENDVSYNYGRKTKKRTTPKGKKGFVGKNASKTPSPQCGHPKTDSAIPSPLGSEG